MARFVHLNIIFSLVFITHLLQFATSLTLNVSLDGGNVSSPLLWGFMFEDINQSGDGGIHGQLLSNNGFQGPNPNLRAYAAVGGATIDIDTSTYLSEAITTSLKVTAPTGANGQVGFSNNGYWGIPVNADTYSTTVYIKGDYSGSLTFKLVSASGNTEFASKDVTVTSTAGDFTEVTTTFQSKQAPDGNNLWTVTFDGTKVAGKSLNFALVMLYPATYKNRANGLKPSLADKLADVKGSFLRFPGGNNLEGISATDYWKWNQTIGPLKDRPGRFGNWGYVNTDALGLVEYFEWCEDMELEPVLDVWAGLALGPPGGHAPVPVTGDALKPYVDDVLAELEFCLGDQSTTNGALRAKYGHSDPFKLNYVEIGNEDNLNDGGPSYPRRFQMFHDAIKAKYPNLTLIASTSEPDFLPDPKPAGMWTDYHIYENASVMVNNFSYFDTWDRNFPVAVMEIACTRIENTDDNFKWPIMQASVAEAVYMIGIERNSDVVKMASYAPWLDNLNAPNRYTPNAITFNQDPNGITLSTTYWVQRMLSNNRGATILPVKADGPFDPLFWVVSKTSDGKTVFVKMANYDDKVNKVTINIPGFNKATHTMLVGGAQDSNTPDDQTKVRPMYGNTDGANGVFDIELPAWSVYIVAATQ